MQTRIVSLVCKRQRLHPKSGQSVIAIVRFYSNFCIRKSDCMFAINQRNDAGIRIIANVASKLIELTLLLCRLAFFFCISPAGHPSIAPPTAPTVAPATAPPLPIPLRDQISVAHKT